MHREKIERKKDIQSSLVRGRKSFVVSVAVFNFFCLITFYFAVTDTTNVSLAAQYRGTTAAGIKTFVVSITAK